MLTLCFICGEPGKNIDDLQSDTEIRMNMEVLLVLKPRAIKPAVAGERNRKKNRGELDRETKERE